MKLKVLVMPVFKKKWMYHAWEIKPSSGPSLTQQHVENPSLPQRLTALGHTISDKLSSTVQSQWLELQQAKEGSFKKWLHKLATSVLSREDPTESFLKAVPRSNCLSLEIIYPASLNQVLVRRRLRTIALTRAHYHRRSLMGWGLICLPQLPLMLTPFPNLTLYYSVYRLMSHYQALGGALSLQSAFTHADRLQLRALTLRHERQLQLQHEEQLREQRRQRWRPWRKHRAGSSSSSSSKQGSSQLPAALTQGCTGQGGSGGSDSRAGRLQDGGSADSQVSLTYNADSALDQMVKPLERWRTPVSDEAIAAVSSRYSLPSLQEYVGRIRARASAREAAQTTA
ncbi:MAG: hypothetical protein WDW36_002283 [Sanguina aurantia]